jgi:hypothetical protein
VAGSSQHRNESFGFHKRRGISSLAKRAISFSRRTLLHGVSKVVNYTI